MKRNFYVSMMCADLRYIEQEVLDFQQAGIDGFHMDIMDGEFVPNFALGLEDIKAVKKAASIPVDAHLMVVNPQKKIDIFIEQGLDIIYVHPEAQEDLIPIFEALRKHQIKVGIALNPETSVKSIVPLLPLVDKVMVMTVTPGFAGQAYIEEMNDKIVKLAKLNTEHRFEIVVDGAISAQRIAQLSNIGVEGFVLGTSSGLFKPGANRAEVLKYLRQV